MSGEHRHHFDPDELVPLDQYRREVLSRIRPLEPILLGLLEAHGCVLVNDVVAQDDIPAFANSAMDGYAVIASEMGTGKVLKVAGEVAAGAADVTEVVSGFAVRIMTGAPIPPGADAVVPVELVVERGDEVVINDVPGPGQNVRPAGEDVRAGTTVLKAGRRLGAADIGMLAATGNARVLVLPQPRVAVLSTGDEIVEPDVTPGFGQIRDVNSFTLTALAREAGATVFRTSGVPDNRRALTEAFEGALFHADVVVTSGGVSAGRYDLVKQVLAGMGDVKFSKVAMQPGMPQAFGFIGDVPCFGLPGNPVSAYVSFEVFVRPALRRLQGRAELNRPRVSAVLDTDVFSPAHKVSFLRVQLHREDGEWHAVTTGAQGSGILASLVAADGLAEIPSDRTHVPAGERVVVHLLVEPT